MTNAALNANGTGETVNAWRNVLQHTVDALDAGGSKREWSEPVATRQNERKTSGSARTPHQTDSRIVASAVKLSGYSLSTRLTSPSRTDPCRFKPCRIQFAITEANHSKEGESKQCLCCTFDPDANYRSATRRSSISNPGRSKSELTLRRKFRSRGTMRKGRCQMFRLISFASPSMLHALWMGLAFGGFAAWKLFGK